ncbi:hypothetical protein L3V77_20970 [Vibrio sp. DW001]|uniref:hypothetical protein n=1 Tax=Vibrio sp. DW001 TaxID=2912315 RepID=UPI0023B18B75|nr:hypothetical protein [Vibrio sp. DW001]WED29881.1 hypothetical protein L3V77_20970 [Vibrio sp. DW001]
MTTFFSTSQTVSVSRLSEEGWWIENTSEHVAKGTALGEGFTVNVYTPSEQGMIGRYDKQTDSWDEIENQALKAFWNEVGQGFVIGVPDGDYPEGAIKEAPPEFDTSNETVLHKDGAWKIYDIEIGKTFYDAEGNEFVVSDFNFDLPDNHSFDAPPKTEQGFAVRLVDNEWIQIIDHREKTIFDQTDCTQSKEVTELGDIPQGWTLDEPATQFDEWTDGIWVTNLSEQYIDDYDEVDSTRRSLYSQMCDPLISEANIKRLQGDEAGAKMLEVQALAAWQKIHDENPWPTKPIS